MWADVDVETLSIVSDLGVGLGHDSQPFLEEVRRFQFCETPIATYPAPLGSSLASDEDGIAGLSDPVARELYVHETVRDVAATNTEAITDPSEALASSVLHVHEPIHAGLADQFTHYYGEIRLWSFIRTLSLIRIGPNDSFRNWDKKGLLPLLSGCWERLQRSQWAQEAVALRAQRQFLEQYTGDDLKRSPDWQSLPEKATYHDSLVEALAGEAEGPLNKKVTDHAMGDWLAEQLSEQPWEFDPLDIVFRITGTTTNDSTKGGIYPDEVLRVAASLEPSILATHDTTGQLSLLLDRLNNVMENNRSLDTVVGGESVLPGTLPNDYVGRSATTVFDRNRDYRYQQDVDAQDWYLLPLVATSYPGTQRGANTTLWELLDGIAVDTAPETLDSDSQPTRRLWLEDRYRWAEDTLLLKLATRLWYLRDWTLLPLIRDYLNSASHNPDAYVQAAAAIFNGKPTTGRNVSFGKTNIDTAFAEQVHQLHEMTPTLREQHSDLFDTLNTLGKAIHHEETDTIDSFYR